jgi:hypothetical protein
MTLILSAEQLQVGDTVVLKEHRYQVSYIENERLGKALYLKGNDGEKALFVSDDDLISVEL